MRNPTVYTLLNYCAKTPVTVGEITDRLRLRQPQASKHLRVLLEAGMVELFATANRRIYKLRPEPFKGLDDWLDSYHSIWNGSYDRLVVYLQELQEKEKQDKHKYETN